MAVHTPKRKEVAHDEAPAIVSDHAFVPRGAWWSLCNACGLAQAAHAETTVNSLEAIREETNPPTICYYADDNPEVFD